MPEKATVVLDALAKSAKNFLKLISFLKTPQSYPESLVTFYKL